MQQMDTNSALSERTFVPAEIPHPIEFLRETHERQKRFCGQLGTLADDIWQLGHEKLALSLLEIATVDIAKNSKDQSELLAPALLRCCGAQAGPRRVVSDMVRRHHSIARLATSTIDGLDLLASGEMPPVPIQFILSALQLTEDLNRNLDWEDEVLLPLVASLSAEDQRHLGTALVRRRRRDHPGMN